MPDVKKIEGRSKTIREILGNTKYSIDFYQREYKWEREHIAALVEDLANAFLTHCDLTKDRTSVRDYPHYFLGSFVLSVKEKKYIIDGQQRLTSLTLLLIFLSNLAKERNIEIDRKIEDLIYSEEYGVKSFNIDVDNRKDVMEKLHKGEPFDIEKANDSSRTMFERYNDIAEKFTDELDTIIGEDGKVLPYFVDWLMGNVDMVDITAYSDDDAYTIFETMNDRGLSLNNTDMLKGYLLAKINDDTKREDANALWRTQVQSLSALGKGQDEELLKTWIRAKYAENIREGKRGATNKDFEIIGTRFHKWVRENADQVGLKTSEDFHQFIMSKFAFFSDLYLKIRKSEAEFNPALDTVFYASYHTFPYQTLLLLSAIKYGDDAETVRKKMQVISRYVEMFIVLRSINFSALGSSSIRYTMFTLMKDVRDVDLNDLVHLLKERLSAMEESFEGILEFGLNQ